MSDEWISVQERLPKVNQEVQVIFGIKNPKGITGFDIGKSFLRRSYPNNYCFDNPTLNTEPINYWRPLKEKRPDFSKLKTGDFIVIEHNNKSLASGFVFELTNDIHISLWNIGHSRGIISKEAIKKITRINLEKQTF